LRSPWIIVAILGLIAALVIIWLGARRARRPKDALVGSGELEKQPSEAVDTPAASRPVLRRLGEGQPPPVRRRQTADVGAQTRARAVRPVRVPRLVARGEADSRPLLDDMLVEIDEPPEAPAPRQPKRTPKRTARPKTEPVAQRQTEPKREYIPLDEL
jgi:hypothetical protein